MRYHKAGKALALLMDEGIPRRSDGALDLCANCQRWMWFAGGYTRLLIQSLEASARVIEDLTIRLKTQVGRLAIGQSYETGTSHRNAALAITRRIADERAWALRCQVWANGWVKVTRLPHPNGGDAHA
jgi:hypothetical protein